MADLLLLNSDLEKRYCPPLDSSLLLVILSDYDLSDPTKLKEACDILDSLAASAIDEEASGFDASGSGGGFATTQPGHDYADLIGEEDVQSAVSGWNSSPDDMSLSTGMSSMELEEDSAACKEHDAQLESLDIEEKMNVIRSIFPGVKRLDIELTLRRCKNKAGQAIEELLNIVLLEETGGRVRGVEGFLGSDDAVRYRKRGRKRRKAAAFEDTDSQTSSSSAAPVSKWETATRDIDFISAQTKHPVQQVTSLYHKNGASTANTIRAILDSQKALNLEYDNPNLDIYAAELSQEYPSIPQDQVKALAELTYPAVTAARELASTLTQQPQKTGGVQFEWRLPPPESSSTASHSNPKLPSSLYPEQDPLSNSKKSSAFHTPKTSAEARALRDKHFSQASAAYRKGNSSNYQGAVAAYYSSQARDYDGVYRSKVSEEADVLVSAQSWDTGLDLHGVGVKDAVRIAREGVTEWWARVGGSGGGRDGYRIVTGIGRHSVGVAKLGPAVGRMLIREGWKVEVGTGFLLVTGVMGGRLGR